MNHCRRRRQRRRAAAIFSLWLWGLVVPEAPAQGVHRLTVAQLNDTYEIFPVTESDRSERRGGMAHVATVLGKLRSEGPVLFLHAGDMFSPSLLSNRLKYRGAQMVRALNAMALDAATFGNHEFDYGCQAVLDRVRESRFPWVVANVVWPAVAQFPEGRVQPALILERAGLRIGIFGVTVPLAPVGGCGAEPIRFREPIEAARAAVAELKRARVDLVIGLTHLRMEDDRRLVESVPDIDLVIGGHEHEVLGDKVGRSLIVKAGSNAVNLGLVRIEAARRDDGLALMTDWQVLPVDAERTPADPVLDELLAPYRAQLAPFAEVIGRVDVPLDGREEILRTGESNLGNYFADLVRTLMKTDIALLNGGSFRDDRVISPGPFTLGDFYTLLPFTNELVAIELTGAELHAALENGVSMVEQNAGRFPQISGMRFRYAPNRPSGQRVLEVSVGDAPLEPERRYSLGTTDFLLSRGEIDGYTGILPQNVLRSGGDLNEALLAQLRRGVPIRAATDGRIARAR